GITAFQEPKSKNASITLSAMSFILGTMFLGITFLAVKVGAVPSEHETVISQLGRAIFGRGMIYTLLITATTVILVMAANTSFADFPRLCALIAGDGFLPRQLTYRSSRLVFGWGIFWLSATAAALIVIFNARTTALIPLYAIGVFMSFTLSQTGMVIHWIKDSKLPKPDKHWLGKLVINAVGAAASFVVMLVVAFTKFSHGAWITVILIPTLVSIFYRIHGHYGRVSKVLGFNEKLSPPQPHPMKTIILLDYVHKGTHRMLEFAKSLGHPWVAVHVNYDEEKSKKVREKWKLEIGDDTNLILISSPYRLLVEPVRDFILAERDRLPPDGFVHVITGQVVIEDPIARLLHSRNARGLLDELQFHERIIVTAVPFQL
ncbi:MAG: APC family permease, partial [Bdellovibrionales bacterium]|nr:APC family permease [Bdellovibrionales bacterium]